MRYSLITQIVLLCLSAIIFVTVTKPMFTTINAVQDEKLVYADAVDKAQQFNAKLQEQMSIMQSFRQEDVAHLDAFLPQQIDVPKVMRDIESFFATTDIQLTSITNSESGDGAAEVTLDENGNEVVNENTLHSVDFTVTFTGTYENLKQILQLAEVNSTLLEITNLSFGETSDSSSNSTKAAQVTSQSDDKNKSFNFSVTFRVYGLQAPKTPVTNDGQ